MIFTPIRSKIYDKNNMSEAVQPTNPKECGKRLQRLRNLANMSRKEFCELLNLNVHTLKGWELGRYGGLPLKAAQLIVKVLKEHNITCDLKWLLHNTGAEPSLLNLAANNLPGLVPEELALEITAFMQQHAPQQILVAELAAEHMLPYLAKGDLVAGRVIKQEQWPTLPALSIVQLQEGTYLCKIVESTAERVICQKLPETALITVEPLNIAAVERIYHLT